MHRVGAAAVASVVAGAAAASMHPVEGMVAARAAAAAAGRAAGIPETRRRLDEDASLSIHDLCAVLSLHMIQP